MDVLIQHPSVRSVSSGCTEWPSASVCSGLRRAQSIIAARPPGGLASAADFLRPFAPGGQTLGSQPLGQLQVTSRWFLIDLQVTVDSARLDEQALIDVGVEPARVVSRSWGDRETR